MRKEGSRGEQPHNQIRKHDIGGKEIEMIHQTVSGDCVLIDYLNTESLVNGRGTILMPPHELRNLVIENRRREGKDAADILEDNQPLNYSDTVWLFSNLNKVKPEQEDILLVNARDIDRNALRNKIENGVLEYLDTYPSGLCTTGMGYHSRSIWKLAEDHYIVIDPTDPNGFSRYNKSQLTDYLTNLCAHQEANNNFFFFLKEKHAK
ncbi:MAG TPA: hypothetical protein VE973_03790 [Candidatus Limnocylindria bacterium]|nr:hypothetical protein [Candidatus Limnocylindria bacterium]